MSSASDLANGLFELGGCVVVAHQCRLVWAAKRVAGVSWSMPAFFWTWGAWNLWYYHDLGQTLSWWAAVLVVLTHSTYAALLWWFARHPGPGQAAFWGPLPPGFQRTREVELSWTTERAPAVTVPAAATSSPGAAGRIPEDRAECGDLLDLFPCLRCGAHVPDECPFYRDHRPEGQTPRDRFGSPGLAAHGWKCRLIQEGRGPCSCRQGEAG